MDGGASAMIVASLISAGGAAYAASKQPKMPKAPKQPEMITGQVAEQKTTGALDEDAVSKTNARKTARKGASAYRIPLQAKSTGISAGGGSGLNI